MLSNAHPISFVATHDARKAREFYETMLGLKFVSEDDFAIVFDVHGTMLRVQKVDRVNPAPYTVLGWSVPDIGKEVAELTQRGLQFSRFEGLQQDELGIWKSPAGAKVAWFSDPDGNVLSLTEF